MQHRSVRSATYGWGGELSSRILFSIRTAERIIELTEGGSEVMERNAVYCQLTRLSAFNIPISAADSTIPDAPSEL